MFLTCLGELLKDVIMIYDCWPSQLMFFVSPDSPMLFFIEVTWTEYS